MGMDMEVAIAMATAMATAVAHSRGHESGHGTAMTMTMAVAMAMSIAHVHTMAMARPIFCALDQAWLGLVGAVDRARWAPACMVLTFIIIFLEYIELNALVLSLLCGCIFKKVEPHSAAIQKKYEALPLTGANKK